MAVSNSVMVMAAGEPGMNAGLMSALRDQRA